MTTDECIAHFGGKPKLAQALGVRLPSLYDWGHYPPPLRQLQLQILTRGKLKAEEDCTPKRGKK
jgi:hypothetical protein